MKLAIISDFHLGYSKFTEDALAQAKEAMKTACEKGADALLLAGDLFDSRTPKQEIIAEAFEVLRIARESERKECARIEGKRSLGIPAVAIHGTHERRTKGLVNPVQILEAADFIVNAHNTRVILEKDGERVAVQGLGGVPDEYAKAALGAANFKPVEGAFNIFMFHQTLVEYVPMKEELMSLEDLPRGFDLYVCGHMHLKRVENFGESGVLLIPGSTVITQLKKEEQGNKGFFFFDTREKKAEFVEIPTRAFFFRELEFKEVNPAEISARCKEEIEKAVSEVKEKAKPIIKLRVSGTLAKGLESSNLDFAGLVRAFEGRAIIEIDRRIESSSLKEKIELLREIREKKKSVREMGLEILKARLRENKCAFEGESEELFALLAENPEEALKKVLEKK
ncbi:MAG: DNA repair exonuclease [Candidatus Micrarchaeota archaeon]